jgi:hypothetical protein
MITAAAVTNSRRSWASVVPRRRLLIDLAYQIKVKAKAPAAVSAR